MADAVTTRVVAENTLHYIVHMTNISDASNETAAIKVDKSTLFSVLSTEPASLSIEKARWNIQGFTSVRILWDHTTDDVAMALAGSGYDDYTGESVEIEKNAKLVSGLKDPRSSGGTGDILLTTIGGVSGSTYDITLWLKKEAV